MGYRLLVQPSCRSLPIVYTARKARAEARPPFLLCVRLLFSGCKQAVGIGVRDNAMLVGYSLTHCTLETNAADWEPLGRYKLVREGNFPLLTQPGMGFWDLKSPG